MTLRPVSELEGRVRLQGRYGFYAYGMVSDEVHEGENCWLLLGCISPAHGVSPIADLWKENRLEERHIRSGPSPLPQHRMNSKALSS